MIHMEKAIVLGLALCITIVSSCKCERAELQATAHPPRTGPAIYATDLLELEDIRDFYKRTFGIDGYTTEWAELDKYRSGSAMPERKPYLDSWYPESTGGSNVNGTLEKYDRAFHAGENKAVAWERDQHSRTQPYWFGHCNGTSVTTMRYQNPRMSVTRPKGCIAGTTGCTEFTPGDIRALLSEMNMNAKPKFISGNRCRLTRAELDQRPLLRTNPQIMDDCDDVNPGSFHVGLVNFLGKMKQPIVFDQKHDEEVWNYPIYSYRFTVSGPLTENQAVAASGLPIDSWIFNARARSWYRIAMTIEFRTFTADFTGAGTVPEALNAHTYDYILELDDTGKVIGGEWINNSRRDHPDFIWIPFEPAEPSGDPSRGNPFVDNMKVTRLWAESVGFNPENPFRDKPKNTYDVRFFPQSDMSWGRVPGYYQLQLDGRRTGAVFLGKKTVLSIDVNEALKTESTVEVTLNGKLINSSPPQGGKVLLLMDSSPGINLLSLKWNSSRVNSSELNWDFRYYAM